MQKVARRGARQGERGVGGGWKLLIFNGQRLLTEDVRDEATPREDKPLRGSFMKRSKVSAHDIPP